MGVSVRSIDNFTSHALVLLAIISLYAFNDQKILLYTIRIIFIIYMLLRLIKFNFKFTTYNLWAIAFLTFTGASALWATDQFLSLYNFTWTLQFLLVSILIGSFIDDKSKLEFVIKCFVTGGILLVARLLIETPIDILGYRRLGTAIGYNSNDVGMKLAFSALCSAFFINKGNKKISSIIVFAILATVVILTGSKKAFAVLVLGVIFYYIFSVKKFHKLIKTIPVTVIILIGFYYLVMNVDAFYNVLGYRIETMIETFDDDTSVTEGSTAIRMQMVSVGLDMFANKPIFGYGIGNYSVHSGFNTYSHNNYIELLTGIGIIGFLLYYSLYVMLLKRLLNGVLTGKKELALPLSFILIIFIIDTGLVSYNTGYIQILLVLCFSFLRINYQDKHSTYKNSLKVKE